MSDRDATKVLLVEGDAAEAFLVKNYLAVVDRDSFAVTHVSQAKEAIDRVRGKIEDRYLGYRFSIFLNIGLPAEWTRQAKLAKP